MKRGLLAALGTALVCLLFPAAGSAQDSKPTEVRVGALVNDVQQLDLQTHSYNVDLYLWFKWKNRDIDPSRSFEFMNAFELWGHILTYETEEPETLPDGLITKCFETRASSTPSCPASLSLRHSGSRVAIETRPPTTRSRVRARPPADCAER